MGVGAFAGVDGEQERKVSVVAVEQEQLPQIVDVVSRHRRKQRIELVVGLIEERTIGVREDGSELSHLASHGWQVTAIENDSEREVTHALAFAQSAQAIA